MGKPSAQVIAVATPIVGDVQIKRHALDVQAAQLVRITSKVGKRLKRWLNEMPEDVACMRVVGSDDRGKPIVEQMRDKDGNPLMEPFLPGEDFRESYRFYTTSVLGMLKEQRERAKLVKGAGAPPLNDDEYNAELELIEEQAVMEMSKERLEELLRKRGAIDAQATEAGAIDPRLKL